MKRFFILMLLAAPTVRAQTADSTGLATIPSKSNFKLGWMAELGMSFTYTNMPTIRSFYKANGIEPDSRFDPNINLNLGVRYNRLKLMLLTGYGFSFTSLPPDEATLVVRQLNAGYAGVMLGYDLVNSRNRRLYLNLGYGAIGYEHSIYRRTNQAVPFESLLQYSQPGTIPSLRLSNNYWDVNLEYTQREKRKQSAQRVLRIGYRRGFKSESWQADAFQLTGAPSDRISQFYVQAIYSISSNYTKVGKR